MTTRRGFLGAMLAAAAAPAFVKAEILMPVRKIVVPATEIILPAGLTLWGDGIHDDTAALQAAVMGEPVFRADGASVVSGGTVMLVGGIYKLSQTLNLRKGGPPVHLGDCRIDGTSIPGDGTVIRVDRGATASIRNIFIEGAPYSGPTYPVGVLPAVKPEQHISTQPVRRSRLLDSMLARLPA